MSSSEEEDNGVGPGGFTINKEYAQRFEDRARRRALWEARQRGLMSMVDGEGGESSSTSESEDEGEQLTPALDLEIMRTIQLIKEKNPRIYDKGSQFYRTQAEGGGDESGSGSDSDGEAAKKKEKKAKPVRAKDVMRQQLLEAAASGKADAFADDEDLTVGRTAGNQDGAPVQAYDQEQRALRDAFKSKVKAAFGEEGSADAKEAAKKAKKAAKKAKKEAKRLAEKAKEAGAGSDSDSDGDGLFAVKKRTQRDAAKEAEDYQAFLASAEGKKVKLQQEEDEKAALQRFFQQKAEDENEQFLRDYVLRRKWAQEEGDDVPACVRHTAIPSRWLAVVVQAPTHT